MSTTPKTTKEFARGIIPSPIRAKGEEPTLLVGDYTAESGQTLALSEVPASKGPGLTQKPTDDILEYMIKNKFYGSAMFLSNIDDGLEDGMEKA